MAWFSERALSAVTVRLHVPYVPTPELVVRRMLTLANLRAGEVVYDLGAGDGRILSSAVTEFDAKAIGVELHEARYEVIAERITREHLNDSARVVQADFFNINLSQADVVTLYLLPSINTMIKPKLERELKPGARVVSHDFPIHGWIPLHVEEVTNGTHSHMLYLYQLPRSLKHQSSTPRAVSTMTKWSGF